MMHKTLLLTLVAAAPLARASTVPAEWAARYKTIKKAICARDLAGWESGIAKDYVWTMPDGKKKNRKMTVAEVKTLFTASKITGDLNITNFKQQGDTAEVTFDMRMKMTFGKHVGGYHEVGTDTWKKIGGKWMEVKTVDTVAKEEKA